MNTLEHAYAHIFAALTPILASTSQLIIKWQVNQTGPVPYGVLERIQFLIGFILTPWVIFAMLLTFASGLTWIMAMTKLDLSYAYPYVSLAFILVPALSIWIFGEVLTTGKIVGALFIIVGISFTLLDR